MDAMHTNGGMMDWEAFDRDVWQNVNESAYAEQWGSLDDSDPDSGFTGVVVTIGETYLGALYGTTENYDGTKRVYLFDTEDEQRDWFYRQTGIVECPECGLNVNESESVWCDDCGIRIGKWANH